MNLGTLFLHGAGNALERWSSNVHGNRNAIGWEQIVRSDSVVALWIRAAHQQWKNHAQKWLGSTFTTRGLHEHHHTGSTHYTQIQLEIRYAVTN